MMKNEKTKYVKKTIFICLFLAIIFFLVSLFLTEYKSFQFKNDLKHYKTMLTSYSNENGGADFTIEGLNEFLEDGWEFNGDESIRTNTYGNKFNLLLDKKTISISSKNDRLEEYFVNVYYDDKNEIKVEIVNY